jgi:hypothetical protein
MFADDAILPPDANEVTRFKSFIPIFEGVNSWKSFRFELIAFTDDSARCSDSSMATPVGRIAEGG